MKNRMDIAKWLDTHTPEILARNKAKRKEVWNRRLRSTLLLLNSSFALIHSGFVLNLCQASTELF